MPSLVGATPKSKGRGRPSARSHHLVHGRTTTAFRSSTPPSRTTMRILGWASSYRSTFDGTRRAVKAQRCRSCQTMSRSQWTFAMRSEVRSTSSTPQWTSTLFKQERWIELRMALLIASSVPKKHSQKDFWLLLVHERMKLSGFEVSSLENIVLSVERHRASSEHLQDLRPIVWSVEGPFMPGWLQLPTRLCL